MNIELTQPPPEGFGFLYKITSPEGKSYIGQTRRAIATRILEHCKGGSYISKQISKFGIDCMIVEHLATVPLDLLDSSEQAEMVLNDSLYPNGYNLILEFKNIEKIQNSSQLRLEISMLYKDCFSVEPLVECSEPYMAAVQERIANETRMSFTDYFESKLKFFKTPVFETLPQCSYR